MKLVKIGQIKLFNHAKLGFARSYARADSSLAEGFFICVIQTDSKKRNNLFNYVKKKKENLHLQRFNSLQVQEDSRNSTNIRYGQ